MAAPANDPRVINVDDEPLSLLNEFVPTESTKQEQERRAFQDRLETFSPLTYFCKPNSLSPVVCARFGWKNAAQDMLVCGHCQAAWAVVFCADLTVSATRHLTCLYETQMSTAHLETCYFRKEAAQYLADVDTTDDKTNVQSDPLKTIVPTLLASVFPATVMRVLEHPNPQNLLGTQWKKLLAAVSSSAESGNGSPLSRVQVPASIKDFRLSPDAVNDTDISLLGTMVSAFQTTVALEPTPSAAGIEEAAAVVLLGWVRYEEVVIDEGTKGSPTSKVSLACPMCLARMKLTLPIQDDSLVESPPPRKRVRQQSFNVVQSHRHYCPYVCGFPSQGASTATPIWQTLATRLLLQPPTASTKSPTTADSTAGPTSKQSDDSVHDDAWIRNILRSAVSPRAKSRNKLAALLEPKPETAK